MKNPNGYGSVYKLSGKRRKPFAVRKTVGWNEKGQPKYQFIGYFETRKEAMMKLAEYNRDPYDLTTEVLTFADVYEKWSVKHFEKVCESNVKGIKGAFKLCEPLHNMPIKDIKLNHLQSLVDNSGKTTPTLKKIKTMLNGMYDYCVMNEILTSDKRDMIRYLDVTSAGNPNKKVRRPFTSEEIQLLWNRSQDDFVKLILMFIYTGTRITEMLDLKKEDVHLDEHYFFVNKSKTEAGVREVPIADKVLPFFEKWMQNPTEYLLCTPEGNKISYDNYLILYWTPIMNELEIKDITPYCTRHTCITLLTQAAVDDRWIKQIVGHKGKTVTEAVYTHIYLSTKLEAINKI